jgi:hypothetical protein
VIELARWGVTGKGPALRGHPPSRKLATLVATIAHLEAQATDDALELFDLLMTIELLARAQRESKAETLRRYPQVSSVDRGEGVTLEAVWQAIETVVLRADLRAAVDNIADRHAAAAR